MSVVTRTAGPVTVVEVDGEVDVYTSPDLRKTIAGAVEDGDHDIVVDLERVTFLDSTGLGVLVGALKRVRSCDGSLRLVCSHDRILKVMTITGLNKVFAIHSSLEDAVADAESCAADR